MEKSMCNYCMHWYEKIETFYLTEIYDYFENDGFLNFAYCTCRFYPNFTKFTENTENNSKNMIYKI